MPRSAAETSSIGRMDWVAWTRCSAPAEVVAGLLGEVADDELYVLRLGVEAVPTAVAPMFCSAIDWPAVCRRSTPRRIVSA